MVDSTGRGTGAMPEAEAQTAQDSLVLAADSCGRGDRVSSSNRFGSLYCSCDVCETLIPQKQGV